MKLARGHQSHVIDPAVFLFLFLFCENSFERIFFDEASKFFSIERLEKVTLPQESRMEAYHSPVDILRLRMLVTRTEPPSSFSFDYTFDDTD